MDIELDIRPYRSEDESCLLAIWRAASAKGHPFFTSEELDAQAQLVREVYLPKAETWVAVLEDEPVGFIGLLDNFIGGLFVDPAIHGRGIGRTLIGHARKLKGTLELEVYALNENARAFYERLGFGEIDRQATDANGLPFEVIRLRG